MSWDTKCDSFRVFERRRGFTLVEIMIVVMIIGLLVAIAIPAFAKARREAQASAIANDFRVFDGVFQHYALETGSFPGSDWSQGDYPVGMETNWLPKAWIQDSPINGGYYVFHDPAGGPALILIARNDIPNSLMNRVDEMLDDGNLFSGRVRGDNQSLDYYIE